MSERISRSLSWDLFDAHRISFTFRVLFRRMVRCVVGEKSAEKRSQVRTDGAQQAQQVAGRTRGSERAPKHKHADNAHWAVAIVTQRARVEIERH